MRLINRVTHFNPPFPCAVSLPPPALLLSHVIWSAHCTVVHSKNNMEALPCTATASLPSLLPTSLACSSGICPFIKGLSWSGPGILKGQNPTQGQHSQPPQEDTVAEITRVSASVRNQDGWTMQCNNLSFINAHKALWDWSRHTQYWLIWIMNKRLTKAAI